MLTPKNALSAQFHEKYDSLTDLIGKLPRIVPAGKDYQKTVNAIDDQWQRLPIALALLPENIGSIEEPDVFWSRIRKHESTAGKREFEELASFALSVLSLPHSNAECERVFSQVNLVFLVLKLQHIEKQSRIYSLHFSFF